MIYPYFLKKNFATFSNKLTYYYYTSATSGTVSTQYFGQKFNLAKVEGNIRFWILINVPKSTNAQEKDTFHLEIEKVTIKEFSEKDQIKVDDLPLDPDLENVTKTFETGNHNIDIVRGIYKNDWNFVKLDMMPGFRLKWYHNENITSTSKYENKTLTKLFVRYYKLYEIIDIPNNNNDLDL